MTVTSVVSVTSVVTLTSVVTVTSVVTLTSVVTVTSVVIMTSVVSLRKHPFLLAPRRWGRFARRSVLVALLTFESVDEILSCDHSALQMKPL